MNDSLFRVGYVTDHAPAKATVAGGVLVADTLLGALCRTNGWTDLVCQQAVGMNELLKILLLMMGLDLITGVMAARSEGQRVSSRRLGTGVKRKTVMLAIVGSAILLDRLFGQHGLPTKELLYTWTTSWFIAVEALSLYENADRMGLKLPKFLRSAVEWLLQKAEKTQVPGAKAPGQES